MRTLVGVMTLLVMFTSFAVPADAAHLIVVDGHIRPRPMPNVDVPIAFVLPDACELYARVQTSQMETGAGGTLIHWMARCPSTAAADLPARFTSALEAQHWTRTASDQPQFTTYFLDALELIFEFDTRSPSVWIGQRYWR